MPPNWVKTAVLSAVFGVSNQQIHRLLGHLPSDAVRKDKRKQPTWVYAPAFVSFWVNRELKRELKKRPPVPENGDPMMTSCAGVSPALERYRAARAKLAELELARQRKEVVDIEGFARWVEPFFKMMGDCAHQLQIRFGPEAHHLYNETLDRAREGVETLIQQWRQERHETGGNGDGQD